ncbi:kinase-like protein [Trametopsis cervina]|nr:kinase-like protein [Trametopsis cervina]
MPAPAHTFIGAVEDEWQLYSDDPTDYTLGPPIGYGASSIVYAATFHPSTAPSPPSSAPSFPPSPSAHQPTTAAQPPPAANPPAPTPCALKVIDLDRLPPSALRLLTQETQLMSLSKHPNVLRVRGTWMDGPKLYIALRLMNAGSAMDVMRYAWPGGMEEEVVRCILRQALEGLNYLHVNGLIHRDVKAANLLIDDDGTVLLGDLGVAAPLWETGEDALPAVRAAPASSAFARPGGSSGGGHIILSTPPTHGHAHTHNAKHRPLGKRKSFVGTPCWMAPEVITGKTYDASADIWSFGITALELAHGRAPHTRSPPSAALTSIALSPPPTLDRAGGAHRYSALFAEVVSLCLNKDPARRPSAETLLGMAWFRGAKKKGYLVGKVLKGLPPLTTRQERRAVGQGTTLTHWTAASWDFSLTHASAGAGGVRMASPTASVYSARSGWKRRSGRVPDEGVFAIEDEDGDGVVGEEPQRTEGGEGREEGAAAYARRVRARQHRRSGSGGGSRSRAHSRTVSLAESIHEDEDEEGETPPDDEPPAAPHNHLDVPAASSSLSSSSPSDSSIIEPATPPSTSKPNISIASSPSGAGRLWRKLRGGVERKDKGGGEGEVGGGSGGVSGRRKGKGGTLGGLLAQRVASSGAGLVRTVSASGNGSTNAS